MNYTQAQIDRANAVSLEDFLHSTDIMGSMYEEARLFV